MLFEYFAQRKEQKQRELEEQEQAKKQKELLDKIEFERLVKLYKGDSDILRIADSVWDSINSRKQIGSVAFPRIINFTCFNDRVLLGDAGRDYMFFYKKYGIDIITDELKRNALITVVFDFCVDKICESFKNSNVNIKHDYCEFYTVIESYCDDTTFSRFSLSRDDTEKRLKFMEIKCAYKPSFSTLWNNEQLENFNNRLLYGGYIELARIEEEPKLRSL